MPVTWVTPENPKLSSQVLSKPADRFEHPPANRDHVWLFSYSSRPQRRRDDATTLVEPKDTAGHQDAGDLGERGGPLVPATAQVCPLAARNRRRRRLLVTTNTEENAIAAPASSGLSMPAAARGRAATL